MKQERALRPSESGVAYREFLDAYANWSGLQRIFITFDVDWAPEYMMQHTLDLLKRYDAGVTFFATHESALLRDVAKNKQHEVGFHSNLQPASSQGDDISTALDVLRSWYPQAVGNRFHLLGYSYRDLAKLKAAGIRYDASTLLFNTSHLQPAFHADLDLTLFPYMWEDGICENAALRMDASSMAIDTPGIKIFNFHPVNLFINGPSAEQRLAFMKEAGPLLQCPEDVARRYRVEGETGAERALTDLLAYAARNKIMIEPLQNMQDAFMAARTS